MNVSPKPWRLDQNGQIVAYPDGLESGVFSSGLPDGEKENNKLEVLKCVNAHDDLVAALEAVSNGAAFLPQYGGYAISEEAIKMVDEALAKAGAA